MVWKVLREMVSTFGPVCSRMSVRDNVGIYSWWCRFIHRQGLRKEIEAVKLINLGLVDIDLYTADTQADS